MIEILETDRKQIPVVLVQMANRGFSQEEARDFASNIEARMGEINPTGLSVLRKHIGHDLTELRDALLRTLDSNEQALVFDPHAADLEMVAAMKDLVERMGEVVGRPLVWENEPRRIGSCSPESSRKRLSLSPVRLTANAVVVCCSQADALGHARVLRSELEQKLGRACHVGSHPGSTRMVGESELLVVLLTKNLLTTPIALAEMWVAIRREVPIVQLAIPGAGYDYADAARFLDGFPHSLEKVNPGGITELERCLNARVDLVAMGKALHAHVTAIIAFSWSPEGSKNQTHAIVNRIIQRIPKRRADKPLLTKGMKSRLSIGRTAGRRARTRRKEPALLRIVASKPVKIRASSPQGQENYSSTRKITESSLSSTQKMSETSDIPSEKCPL